MYRLLPRFAPVGLAVGLVAAAAAAVTFAAMQFGAMAHFGVVFWLVTVLDTVTALSGAGAVALYVDCYGGQEPAASAHMTPPPPAHYAGMDYPAPAAASCLETEPARPVARPDASARDPFTRSVGARRGR